jgi:hypothetical protein
VGERHLQPLRERLPLVESAMELAALRGKELSPPHDAAFVEIAVAAQADVFLVCTRFLPTCYSPYLLSVECHHRSVPVTWRRLV